MAIPKVHRVHAADLKVGEAVERKEHPSLGAQTVRRVARDHLQTNPNYYSGGSRGGEGTTVVFNQNVKAIPTRKKKKVAQPKSTMPEWIRF